ncbi:MAG: OmpA family protein [Ottowia sp.]|nr:OmpA family protein [Ottowia sp.]
MRLPLAYGALGALLLACAGCAPATRVVLLPQADSSASAVVVETQGNQAVLDQPHEEARVFSANNVRTRQSDPEAVERRYGELLAAAPPPVQRHTLYFNLGTAQLTEESISKMQDVLEEAKQRPGGEIVITGHTDSLGDLRANDALSLQRALAIREMFIERGFDPMRVEAAGRGEREPLYPTADNVAEPRNRRAEILVR